MVRYVIEICGLVAPVMNLGEFLCMFPPADCCQVSFSQLIDMNQRIITCRKHATAGPLIKFKETNYLALCVNITLNCHMLLVWLADFGIITLSNVFMKVS